MYKAIIREETFGGVFYNFTTGGRYLINNDELKNIIENSIYPSDFKEKDIVDSKNIRLVTLSKNENIIKFSFADVVFIELTRACNLKCKHCLNNSGNIMQNQLNKEEMVSLIKKLILAGVQEIRFTGGEPLLCSEIYDYIKLCSDSGISTSIGTNGTLITLDIVHKLVESGLKRCVISLDGTKEAHDQIRGKGNFDKSMKALKLLIDNNVDVRINSVIMKSNMMDVIKLAKKLDKMNIKLYIRRFIESGRGKNLSGNGLSLEEYEVVKEKLKRELQGKNIDGHFLHSSDMLKTFRIPLPFSVSSCRAGQRSFAIMPNGDVYPCGFLAAQGYSSVGNVREIDDFRKFWNDLQTDKNICSLRDEMIKRNDKQVTCMAHLYSILNQ